MNPNINDYTTAHTFAEIESAISIIKRPTRPTKPSALNINTAGEAHEFANRMTAYERELDDYNAACEAARELEGEFRKLWERKLRAEYSHWNDGTFGAVYSMARDETRRYSELRNHMEDMEPLVDAIISANTGFRNG